MGPGVTKTCVTVLMSLKKSVKLQRAVIENCTSKIPLCDKYNVGAITVMSVAPDICVVILKSSHSAP